MCSIINHVLYFSLQLVIFLAFTKSILCFIIFCTLYVRERKLVISVKMLARNTVLYSNTFSINVISCLIPMFQFSWLYVTTSPRVGSLSSQGWFYFCLWTIWWFCESFSTWYFHAVSHCLNSSKSYCVCVCTRTFEREKHIPLEMVRVKMVCVCMHALIHACLHVDILLVLWSMKYVLVCEKKIASWGSWNEVVTWVLLKHALLAAENLCMDQANFGEQKFFFPVWYSCRFHSTY